MSSWGWELLFCSLFVFLLHWGPDSASIAAALAAQDGEVFGVMCLWQPLKGACSRGGFQDRLPLIPPYGLLMCGIIQKPVSATYIHAWLVILEYVINHPEFVPLVSFLAGKNQSVPRNLALHMQMIEPSCFWSSSKDAELVKEGNN